MSVAKRKSAMLRMSIYISEENRRRLADVPRGEKTELVNKALDGVLSDLEKKRNFDDFLEMVRQIKPVKMRKSSEQMIRELRETGRIEP
jgi:hypothetical protein